MLFLSAILLPASAFAEISTQEVIELGRRFEPEAFAYAEREGAKIIPTKDGRSFVLVWLPEGFDAKKDIVLVSTHGHQGWAPRDFQVWHKHIGPRRWAFIGIQWWYGRSAEPIGYAKPKDIYPWIVEALEERGVPRGHVIFTGFSMGGANSYAVTFLDRLKPDPYFGLTISNAGYLEEDYPPNKGFLDGRHGSTPFQGAHWILYCAEKDEQRPQSCENMERTKITLEKLGATVERFIRDPQNGHGGFMKDENNKPALDLAETILQK